MIEIENIYINLDTNNTQDLFEIMSKKFLEQNYVNDGYLESLIEREKNYPTGLHFNNFNIAIPHTYSKYIKEEKIVFIKLKNEIEFVEMGTSDNKLDVKIVFMLLIKNGEKQIQTLLKLMSIFEKDENYYKLIKLEDKKEIFEFLKEKLK